MYLVSNRFNFRTFRWMQTMIFAIEKINRDNHLLPNITLGYKIYDSCSTPLIALRTAMELMGGREEESGNMNCQGRVPVVIGDGGSTLSMVVAHFLGVFQLPQVRIAVWLTQQCKCCRMLYRMLFSIIFIEFISTLLSFPLLSEGQLFLKLCMSE